MDVFKAWPGRAESIVISQESYMRCTGGVAPWRRDGDKGPSYYAVCPLCDNPIQIVGLFRRQEESRARRPYGRHHRGDVPNPAATSGYSTSRGKRCNPTRVSRQINKALSMQGEQ